MSPTPTVATGPSPPTVTLHPLAPNGSCTGAPLCCTTPGALQPIVLMSSGRCTVPLTQTFHMRIFRNGNIYFIALILIPFSPFFCLTSSSIDRQTDRLHCDPCSSLFLPWTCAPSNGHF
ncbi:hypothetical protein XELAEV_18003678mg [Xenopus laevis]|nr:hypothetical protein XELAEV_18003678mg [Xenopus laevis]